MDALAEAINTAMGEPPPEPDPELDPGSAAGDLTAPAPAAGEVVPRIGIGGFSVPLRWALGLAKPACERCGGRGLAKFVGSKAHELCACVVNRAMGRLDVYRRAQSAKPVDPPAPERDRREQERLDRKVRMLRAAVDDLESELAHRAQRAEQAIAEDVATVVALARAEQDAAACAIITADRLTSLRAEIAEAEKALAEKRAMLRGLEGVHDDAFIAQSASRLRGAELEGKIARARAEFERNTTGLRKEIAKTRRRLNAALVESGEKAEPVSEGEMP